MYDHAEILIVEDSPTQATELQYLLEASGCQVRIARNGVEALAKIGEHLPTIVISDIVIQIKTFYGVDWHNNII